MLTRKEVEQLNYTSLTISVPTERVPELYSLLAQWTRPESASPVEADSDNGSAEIAVAAEAGRAVNGAGRGKRRSRYEALKSLLQDQSGAQFELSFEGIEKVIGGSLPPSAREYRAWWSNSNNHSQARSWLTSGWRVHTGELSVQTVKFTRN